MTTFILTIIAIISLIFVMQPPKETLAKEAYRLLKQVSKDQWIIGNFSNNKNACCALGHWTRLKSKNPNDFSRDNCFDLYTKDKNIINLRNITLNFLIEKYNVNDSIVRINDSSKINGYNEDHPKDRVLHLLSDMIKAGY